MDAFEYTPLPGRVVFGHGTTERAADELRALGRSRAFVLSDAHHASTAAARLLEVLGDHAVGVSTDAAMHTPVEVAERVLQRVAAADADCLVSLGGGSTTGLSKALALRTGLPQIAIPTTYAGSEATPILGQTAEGRKTTTRSLQVLPKVIIYDVDLTLGLPAGLSVVSGMNAIAHAVEALYAKDANPAISMLAEQGIEAIARALRVIVAETRNRQARSDALFGAWACGTCLGSVGMSLHHKLCHTLGGSFDLPHAETHTVILPHAVAFNRGAAPHALARAAHALGVDDAASGLFDLGETLGAPTSLKALGMAESKLDEAAEILWREESGEPLIVRGRVSDVDGTPIVGAIVEVWQTSGNQLYDVQDQNQPRGHLRATFRTDAQGEYEFKTVMPVSYPIPTDGPAGQLLEHMGRHPFRPAHIHFMISAPRYRRLVTHLFLADDPYLQSDAVFGVKPSLIVKPERHNAIQTINYDFGLARTDGANTGIT